MNNIFKEINTEEAAYILGFISADGCITKDKNSLRIHLKNGQSEINLIKKIHQILNLKTKISFPRNNSVLLIANNKELKNNLNNLGITSSKTFTVPFIILSKHLMPHYIRGYFDGDGWISFSKKDNYSYITTGLIGNSLFCQDLNSFLEKEINFTFSYSVKNNMIQLQSSGCNKCFTFLNYIYSNSTIHLERKYILYKNLEKFIQKKEKQKEDLAKLKCPFCLTNNLKKYGSKKLKTGMYKKYKCNNCNKSTIKPVI